MRSKDKKQYRVAAFEEVVHHYETRLLRYATNVINNPDLAQDIVQDTFIRMFRKWRGEFEPSPALSSWLYRTTHNCAVDVIRKQERRKRTEKEHQEIQPEPIAMPVIQDEDETAQKVRKGLSGLPTRDRELIVLKVYEEKSYKEISEITGLSVGNVGYILHHAMRKLADAIGRES